MSHRILDARPRRNRRLQVEREPLRLERLEDRCLVCGVLPTALDDGGYWVTAGETLSVLPGGVLENDGLGGQGGEGDTDPCGTTLRAVLVEGPSAGSLSLNSDGSFDFTTEFVGGVTFTYMACDDQDYCSTVATVTVNVVKKPGRVVFFQETNSAPFGSFVGPYGQPGGPFVGRTDGGFYESNPTGTWATSWVRVWTTAAGQDVCNSGPGLSGTTGAGQLRAVLFGSWLSSYTVSLQIDVSVTTTSVANSPPGTAPANNPEARAAVTDLTVSPQVQLGAAGTSAANGGSDFISLTFSATVTTSLLGVADLIIIKPVLCGTNAPRPATADFTATIYVNSVV